MKKQSIYIGITVVVAIVIILALTLPKDSVAPGLENAGLDSDTAEEVKAVGSNFEAIKPSEWSGKERAQQIINETQGKAENEEHIQYGVIQDPNESNIYYFATYGSVMIETDLGPAQTNERFVGIYKYNTDNFNWERLFKTTKLSDEPGDPSIAINVLGYQDDHLIIRKQNVDYSPGPCSSRLLQEGVTSEGVMHISDLLSLDLSNPYDAFSEFTLPDYVRSEEEAIMAKCFEDNF